MTVFSPWQGQTFFSSHHIQTGSGANPASYRMGTMNLTSLLGTVPKLRMSGALPLIPDTSLQCGA
jgi:hypothetical protein